MALACHEPGRILGVVLRKLGLIFAALAFFSIAGGHWAVLQSVAWVGMLHDYAQRTGSVTAAVAQTFDGQHPCELCREIAVAKAKEHKERPTAPGMRDDASMKARLVETAVRPLAPAATLIAQNTANMPSAPGRAEQPPTPPPRRKTDAA